MNSPDYNRLPNHDFSPDITRELDVLAESDNWHSLVATGLDYILISLAVVAGQTSVWLYPLAVLVIGARQRALTTILHEAAHNRGAKNRWLNKFVGRYLSGYLIFQSFQPYRQSHVINHHGHLGDGKLDPDYQLYLDSGLYNGITTRQFLWRQVLATLLMANALGYLWYVVKNRSISLSKSKIELAHLTAYWAVLLTVIHVLGGWQLFLLYWIVPYITAFLIIGRFIEIAEHYPLLGSKKCKTILDGTRNRFSHPLEAFFCSMHNENYHLVHHLRPDIPFWNAHKAHRVMMRDAKYARINRAFGGIFFSNNGQPALIPALVAGKILLPLKPE
jgi:fatty acid desaturase